MILTPLQALAIVALTVLLCGAAMILIHRHMPLRNKTLAELQGQIDHLNIQDEVYQHEIGMLKHRTKHLEQAPGLTTTTNLNLPADDDAMALWDAIVNDARKHENPRP